MKQYILSVTALALLIATPLFGQIPQTLSYQGVLTNASGTAVTDGNYSLTFKLYESATSGPSVWEETQGVTVANGIFNVVLGSSTALNLPFDKQYWLGITLDGGSELQPRIQLTAAAYSLNARSLADSTATGATIANGSVVRSFNSLTEDVNLVAGNNVIVTNDGNSVVISATGVGLTLPFRATVNESERPFDIVNAGLGGVAAFQALNENTLLPVLDITQRGVGVAGVFSVTKNDNFSPALEATTKGRGPGLLVEHEGSAGNLAEFKTLSGNQVTFSRDGNITTAGHLEIGGKIIFSDGTEQSTAASANGAEGWLLTGNAGTDTSNFIGTIDNLPFEIKVNNARGFRLEPAVSGAFFSPNVIGGFAGNEVVNGAIGATISGGGVSTGSNQISVDFGAIGGGKQNLVSARFGTVAGGSSNIASGEFATVGGGENNQATVEHATVAGGKFNKADNFFATVSGGELNRAFKSWGTIAGGQSNSTEADFATVSGGQQNQASASHATVGGGKLNKARGDHATVGGGENNVADFFGDTVSGGRNNVARNVETGYATVGGGDTNQAINDYATVSGGHKNIASGPESTVSGGDFNRASSNFSTVGGGRNNIASDQGAAVPGGRGNHARGSHSFAAGYHARAIHDGSFVWNDRSVTSGNDSLVTTANNQFLIRAAGGVGIGTMKPDGALHVVNEFSSTNSVENILLIERRTTGIPANGIGGAIEFRTERQDGVFQTRTGRIMSLIQSSANTANDRHSLAFEVRNNDTFVEGMRIRYDGNVGVGVTSPTEKLHVNGNALADAHITPSSRRWKTNIETIENPLEKVQRLRGVTYDWKASGKHDIGLIAEEVGAVIPEIVAYEENGVDARSVDYARLVAVLIEAVKELSAKVERLENANGPELAREK